MSHHEVHRAHRVGWLRAAVLGANDGIVSTASLLLVLLLLMLLMKIFFLRVLLG